MRAYPPRSTNRSPPVIMPISPLVSVRGDQLNPSRGWKLFLSVFGSGCKTKDRVVAIGLKNVLRSDR